MNFLFANNVSLSAFPLKVYYNFSNNCEGLIVNFGVGVNAKKIKLAVDRNRIKRLIRESYRLNKAHLLNAFNCPHVQLDLFILFQGNQLETLTTINDKWLLIINLIHKKYLEACSKKL